MKTVVFVLLFLAGLSSCHKVDPGFLKAEGAHYQVDSLVVKAELDPVADRERIEKELPWQSEDVDGVLGTPQVRSEIAGVHPDEGNVGEQVRMSGKGRISVAYDHSIPAGVYWVDVLIYNEGHSLVKDSLLRVVVK